MFVATKSPLHEVAAVVAIVLLAAPCMAGAEDALADALERCGLIDAAGTRLACYDGIIGREPSSPDDVAAVVATPSAASVQTETSANSSTQKNRAARVTACSKNVSDQFVFTLDNGEVWQQSNYRRLSLGECDFAVTLTRGLMGYKMRQEGTEREFRVSRVK